MSFEPHELLRHILAEADYLLAVSATLSREQLEDDPTLQRAIVRSIEIIGEASKRVPTAIKEANPKVQWRSMSRMRDRLVHDYFGIDLDIVWDVVQTNIPPLRAELNRILAEQPEQ